MQKLFTFIQNYYIGDIASIIGLLITFIGFFFTILNTFKSKSAAENTEKEVHRIRESISKQNALINISSGLNMINEIKKLNRTQNWDILVDRYTELRHFLINLKEEYPQTNTLHLSLLQNAITQTKSIQNKIETYLYHPEKQPDIGKINKTISKIMDDLQVLIQNLKKEII